MASSPEFPTTFFFTSRDFRNNTILSASDDVMYTIETEGPVGWFTDARVTNVYRPSRAWPDLKELVATIEWESGKSGRIELGEITYELNDIFHRKPWRKARTMDTPYGVCKWTSKCELHDGSGRLLVTYNSNQQFYWRKDDSSLSVASDALPYLDKIILGWMVMMRDNEHRHKTAADAGRPYRE
ncbi:hypothetical protein DL93DRAFT_2155167 [Clavulina sp. PMI_390]|nr:hypothetical protein DL93DRAFT_2155167 [Clavulina sp. PMI_390]